MLTPDIFEDWPGAKLDGPSERCGDTDIGEVMQIKRGKPFMAVDAGIKRS
ncbi:hypothetical protein [Allochromatium palmeri]|uniref:Uncharacterized protein n=1 Tax=Allochromatium palmeri TaxID=231048 RepID=A0A6N8E9F3_9GAMM|nr:hypothetical protein [Allochromatium palmeri]MTW20913.1 hypothetical protein [Allochromatium palmeri]